MRLGTRAYIGGDATSNVRAGKWLLGIPVSGTHAHALAQAYRDDYGSLKRVESQQTAFLVDTYDIWNLVFHAIRS